MSAGQRWENSTSASGAGEALRQQAPHTDLEALWRCWLMEIIARRGSGKARKVTACSAADVEALECPTLALTEPNQKRSLRTGRADEAPRAGATLSPRLQTPSLHYGSTPGNSRSCHPVCGSWCLARSQAAEGPWQGSNTGMELASLSSELLSREPLTLSAAVSRQTSAVCHVLLKHKVRRCEQPFHRARASGGDGEVCTEGVSLTAEHAGNTFMSMDFQEPPPGSLG